MSLDVIIQCGIDLFFLSLYKIDQYSIFIIYCIFKIRTFLENDKDFDEGNFSKRKEYNTHSVDFSTSMSVSFTYKKNEAALISV